MPKGAPVSIMGVWLYRSGDCAKVAVEFSDGRIVEAISEQYDGCFSHHISEHGLARLRDDGTTVNWAGSGTTGRR